MAERPRLSSVRAVLADRPWLLVCGGLLVFFLVGVLTFADYGMHWDDLFNRDFGKRSWGHAVAFIEQGPPPPQKRGNEHGTAFELILYGVERGLGLSFPDQAREIYLLRHFLTFLLFFASVCVFYLFCRDLFSSRKLGSIGCLILVLHPRIYAHAFYNSNDIGFLAASIFCGYGLFKLITRPSPWMAVLAGFACGFATDIRIVGILYPVMGLGLILLRCAPLSRERVIRHLGAAVILSLSVIVTVIALWPFLWSAPVSNFAWAIGMMSRIPWTGSVLYMGDLINGSDPPWHYTLGWLAVTTPALVVVLAALGLAAFGRDLVVHPLLTCKQRPFLLYITSWLIVPMVAPVVLGSTLFDSWRHHFFVYPAVVVLAVLAIERLWALSNRVSTPTRLRSRRLAVMVGASYAVVILVTMVALHPLQNVYFNSWVGGTSGARGRFELDYWGVSYRLGLTRVLEADSRAEIKLAVAEPPGRMNAHILAPADRRRLKFVNHRNRADYFLGAYRTKRDEYGWGVEVGAVRAGGAKVLSIRTRVGAPPGTRWSE